MNKQKKKYTPEGVYFFYVATYRSLPLPVCWYLLYRAPPLVDHHCTVAWLRVSLLRIPLGHRLWVTLLRVALLWITWWHHGLWITLWGVSLLHGLHLRLLPCLHLVCSCFGIQLGSQGVRTIGDRGVGSHRCFEVQSPGGIHVRWQRWCNWCRCHRGWGLHRSTPWV